MDETAAPLTVSSFNPEQFYPAYHLWLLVTAYEFWACLYQGPKRRGWRVPCPQTLPWRTTLSNGQPNCL